MKLRSLIVVLVLAVGVTATVWTWRAVRHARLNLVTLHVRNAPLGKVLNALERQTRERIAVDQAIATNNAIRLTLDLHAVQLADALADVAMQVGAVSRETHVVFTTHRRLADLVGLLRSGTDPAAAGWTNLKGNVPLMPAPDQAGHPVGVTETDDERIALAGDGPVIRPFPSGREDSVGSVGGPGRARESAGAPMTRRVVTRIGSEGEVRSFDVSPEQLFVEEGLPSRLPAGTSLTDFQPRSRDAARLAEATQSRWTTLHTLERSPVPGLTLDLQRGRPHKARRRVIRENADDDEMITDGKPDPAAMVARAAAKAHRSHFDRIEGLTPEQRARQAGAMKATIDVRTEAQ